MAAERVPEDGSANCNSLLRISLVAVTLALALQFARVFIPIMFNLGERSGTASSAIKAGALALGVFLAPVLAPVLPRLLGARRSLVATLAALAGLRLVIQMTHPVPLWLATVGMVVALLGVTLLLLAMRGAADVTGGHEFMLGILVGLAVDTALRSAFWSWDYVWQRGAIPFILAVVLAAAELLLSASGPGATLSTPEERGSGRVSGAALIGPYLFLQVLFLQSVAFVASSGSVSLPIAAGLVLVGDALALAIVGRLGEGTQARSVRIGAGTALIVVAFLLRYVDGGFLIGVVLAGQVFSSAFLAVALARPAGPARRSIWRNSVGVAIGTSVFMLLLVLYHISYRVALPFPNSALAPVAALLVVLGGFAAAGGTSRRVVPSARTVLIGVPIVLLAIPVAMLLARSTTSEAGNGTSVRLLSYNIHLAINSDGQVDPEAVARVIERRHADVVALQEVSRGWPGGGGIDLAEWLSSRLGMNYVFSPAADDQFGNLVLTRFRILESRLVSLPKVKAAMHRSYAAATIGVGQGRSLTVVDAHLEGTQPDHAAQSQSLIRTWAGVPATVIAGDMNMQPADADRAKFDQAGLTSAQDLAGKESLSTASKPKFAGDRVDYIFGTSDVSFSGFDIGPETAADHRPLAVTVMVA